MSWNYRVVRRQYEDGREEFGVYSVYYDDDGNIDGMSVDPVPVNSYSLEGLADFLEFMKEILQQPKPILEYERQKHECVARAQIVADADELRELYSIAEEGRGFDSTDRIEALRTLIRNPSTPMDVLTSISQLRNFPAAPQLRHEAKCELFKRNQQKPF